MIELTEEQIGNLDLWNKRPNSINELLIIVKPIIRRIAIRWYRKNKQICFDERLVFNDIFSFALVGAVKAIEIHNPINYGIGTILNRCCGFGIINGLREFGSISRKQVKKKQKQLANNIYLKDRYFHDHFHSVHYDKPLEDTLKTILTEDEFNMFNLLLNGVTQRSIALREGCCPSNISLRIKKIRFKLQDRQELVKKLDF